MLLRYVGPPHLRALISPTRRHIENARDVMDWARQCSHGHGQVTVTFIVNARGELWIRRPAQRTHRVRGGRIGFERGRNDVCDEKKPR